MNRLSFVALGIIVCCSSVTSESSVVDLILFERNPWRTVIGSDSPVFVHYSDGLTIFLSGKSYKSVRLSEEEGAELLSRFLSLGELKPNYSFLQGIDVTDLPAIELYFRSVGELKRVTVYGSLKMAAVAAGTSVPNGLIENLVYKGGAAVPKALIENLLYLESYSHQGAIDWSPAYVELMVWPFEYAQEESIFWPEGFPDIDSFSTIKRGSSSYSIYLPYSMNQELMALLRTSKQGGALVMNGKKWAFDTRIPFPHEIASNKALQPTQ
jgi:hypothetical protein